MAPTARRDPREGKSLVKEKERKRKKGEQANEDMVRAQEKLRKL